MIRPFRLSRREAERLRKERETAEFVAQAKLEYIRCVILGKPAPRTEPAIAGEQQ